MKTIRQQTAKKDKFKTFVKLDRSVGGDSLPDTIHVARSGRYDKHGMEFEFTRENFEEMVRNFEAGVTNDIPVTAGHDMLEEKPAVGWIKQLSVEEAGDGIFDLTATVVEWVESGKNLLANREFKYFSGEFAFNARDEEGKVVGTVMFGGALTNKPFLTKLRPLMASRITHNLDNDMFVLEDILEKAPADLNDEERDFLRSKQSELTNEDLEKFNEVFDQGDDSADADNDAAGDAGDDNQGDDAGSTGDDSTKGDDSEDAQGEDAKLDRRGNQIVMSKAQYEALEKKANAGHQANVRLQKMEIEQRVDSVVLSAANPDGRILSKDKEAVTKFMLSLTENQREQFVAILSKVPQNTKALSREIGSGADVAHVDASDALDKEAEKLSASKGISYSEAIREVSNRPEFKERLSEVY